MISFQRSASIAALSLALGASIATAAGAQQHITTPKEEFGANFGDDYFLANYKQISDYWHKLARESNRIVLHDMGKTPEGRTQLMAIVTSPENHKKLAHYKDISARLAHAEGLTDAQARALAKEGKAVVWIDGGLHASEVLGAQQLGETVYQMVSRTDEETTRFLNDVIILFVHANPDGNDLVADWYMRNPVPTERTLNGLPRAYQHYIGHENNRDFLASTQLETKNIDRALYLEWFPQILYNHHQSGPAGTVVYSPPLRDPYNYNLDPVLILGLQSLGAAMHTRLAIEGKGGATMRSGGSYDGWWNGGLRNTATFHNTIAMLTEMIGSPTPTRVPLILDRQIPIGDLAMPVPPQEWHFRQSIDYSVSLNRATLDFASRMRENLLFNIYVMGKHSIERGSHDTWTPNPRRESAIAATMNPTAGSAGAAGRGGRGGGRGSTATGEQDMALWAAIHAPDLRDPRGYIIPSDQVDFPTATKFVNMLLESGIAVSRATRAFDVAGKKYSAGSYVVQTAQAFRPHIIDMFEPQVHPDVFPFPGAPPTRPYDNAGWTMSYQTGIQYDRILDGFTGPFEKVGPWDVATPAGAIASAANAVGFVTDNRVVNSFIAATRLLKSNEDVFRLTAPLTVNGKTFAAGALYIRSKPSTAAALQHTLALGVTYEGTSAAPPADAAKLRTPRIGMWDVYGGNQEAGWMRWVLDTYEFSFDRLFAPALDAGNLDQKYDVLIFPQGGIPGAGGGRGGVGTAETIPNLPAEYQGQVGRVTVEQTLPRVREFLEKGGTVIAIGTSAANLADYLKLPVESQLVENGAPLPATKLFIPGSVLSAKVDPSSAATAGMLEHTNVFFDNSPVFKLGPDAAAKGVKTVMWFDSATPLKSGWAWGQNYLENGAVAIEATVGKGTLLMFGPKIVERGQPHQTFKFLFNGIYYSVMNSKS